LVDSLRSIGKEFALVDLGDFMNNEPTVGDLKSRYLWKTMEQMGYTASAPGVRELSAWKLYRELVSSSTIRGVCSNLKVVDNGRVEPAGLPYFVTTVSGVRVGFFALIGANEVSTVNSTEGLEFRPEDPLATAQKIVPELRKSADLVVLLSQMSPDETDDILKGVQGIDVALYGRSPMWQDRVQKVMNTLTQQTGIRGQYVGDLVLIVDPDSRIVEYGSRNIALDTAVREKPEISAQVKQIDDQAKELMKVDQQKKSSEIESKISSEKFIGADKCRRCHETQYAQWLTTPHAKALTVLADQSKQADEKCVGCHVTGWQKTGGYSSTLKDPDLANVQCEACHDVGTKHGRGEAAAKITEATCTACHTGDWGKAKGFDYATYLKRVAH
jgi:2',3'-cyclic-nucleotide 2'-phosphodiesterase (5'-nucleotidase family)